MWSPVGDEIFSTWNYRTWECQTPATIPTYLSYCVTLCGYSGFLIENPVQLVIVSLKVVQYIFRTNTNFLWGHHHPPFIEHLFLFTTYETVRTLSWDLESIFCIKYSNPLVYSLTFTISNSLEHGFCDMFRSWFKLPFLSSQSILHQFEFLVAVA